MGVFTEQRSTARLFCTRSELRVPVVVSLTSSFGGSLSFTILPYFLTALGLSAAQIGIARSTTIAGATLLAPAYGWAFDRVGAYWPLWISCFWCAIGCALLAFARSYTEIVAAHVAMGLGGGSLSSLALAFVTTNTALQRRTLVISAYDLQAKVVAVAGRICYIPFNAALVFLLAFWAAAGAPPDDVYRYRLTIGLCLTFCGAGCVVVLLSGSAFRTVSRANATSGASAVAAAVADGEAEEEEEEDVEEEGEERIVVAEIDASVLAEAARGAQGLGADEAARGTAKWAAKRGRIGAALAVYAGATLLAAAASEAMLTAWPLFLLLHFHWGASEWALLSIASNVAVAAAASLVPGMRRSVGAERAASALALCAALSGVAAFAPLLQGGGGAARALHVAASLCAIGAAR